MTRPRRRVVPVLSRWDLRALERILRDVPDWDVEEREDLIERLRGTVLAAEVLMRLTRRRGRS